MNRLLSIVVTLCVLFLVYIWINHIVQRGGQAGTDQLAESTEQLSPPTHDMARTEKSAATSNEKPDASILEEMPAKNITAQSSSGNAVHLVIAGNFLERSNADKMVNNLKKLGYSEAAVIRFELSEYHTVCAGRFDDPTAARRYSKKLKDRDSIDSYVRIAN